MKTTKNLNIWLAMAMLLLLIVSTATGQIIFVDADANGLNDGSSWADAYNYLQDALADANSGDEIWVAEGIYKPDEGAGITPGDRTATFKLINGVTIKGGYAGFGQPDPDTRDIEVYETVLSGDLNGNDIAVEYPKDLFNEPTRSENSYNVTSGRGTDSTAVLDGFTIIAGNANGSYHYYFNGGGMNNYSGSPTVLSCKFYSNSANYGGGGMSNGYNSSKVVNCQFIGNSADRGGGMYNSGVEGSLTVLNCAFSGNAARNGGAMYNFYCDPTIINCTLSVNSSWADGDYRAGGMVNWHTSSPTITNCIFWGNSTFDGQMDESAQLNYGTPIVNYCCIQGWTGDLGGTGNFGDDPLFVEALGADNIPGTVDDNPRLLAGSPSLDAGDNLAVPPSLLTDLDGNPRIINGTVDMGAYEGPKQGFLLSSQSVTVPESQTATFTVALATDPLQTVLVTVAYQSGDPDIAVQSGTLLTFNSSNHSEPQTVTLAAAEDADYLHGKALIWVSATAFVTAALDATEVDNDVPTVLYVDADAPGINDGTSWENAFTDLQNALAIATAYHQIEDICVAQGIYKPDQGAEIVPGDIGATFQLISGVAIKGGYAGFGEPDPNARDIELYETILNGDLSGDDIELTNPADMWGEQSRRNNSEHVVTGSYVDANAILDGFTITAGYNGNLGAGMYNRDSNPTVTNCTFTWNCAEWGGGMGNWNSSPTVIDCKFESNAAAGGGGIDNVENSNPILTNCTFSGNSGFWRGGGMLNGYAGVGGSATPILNNCIFSGNSTDHYGGGMYNEYSSPIFTNCTFTGNAAELGGGMFNASTSNPTLINCILWGNAGRDGMDESAQICGETPVINYCCIQGWTGALGGTGNINADPLFLDATSGDYHLKSAGWRWHRQRQVWTWDEVTSPCIDAGNPGSPLGDELMSVPDDPNNEWGENLRINMGAYGGTAEASMAPRGWALLSDLSNDGIVNFVDLALQVQDWLITANEQPGDLNRDAAVNMIDFAILAKDWLKRKPFVVKITKPENGAEFYDYETIEIEADASDDDGEVVKVEFFANGNKIGEDNYGSDGWKTNWEGDHALGSYNLTTKATNDNGATTVSLAVAIRIDGGEPPPW